MLRRKRMCLPGYPCHIVQRGNGREASFVEIAMFGSASSYGRWFARFCLDLV